jgi:hypothetical protein
MNLPNHPLYQQIMFTNLSIGTKALAVVVCALFDKIPPEEQNELLHIIDLLAQKDASQR